MLKVIVFDCDGVMFDSKQANIKYYNAVLQHFGLPPMDAEEETVTHMASVEDSLAHIFRNAPQITQAEIRAYLSRLTYEPFLPYMHMEADLIEFLNRVEASYKLAISTNRSGTMLPLLKRHGLERYFEKVVTALSAKRPKPAPDGLLEILDHFSCQPEEAIFIGDSIVDQQQADACRVDLIAFKSPDLPARYHVQSFLEILELPPFRDADS
ncbi:MAG: beta-phosphoglucomutase [Deltaproteobacteria bacterium]|nr:MAG: beta-phosphoglucomutase [Deltaproteobacteria bacterium]